MKISDLVTRLLHLEPQRSPARQAFYHYLKNLCDLDATFSLDIVDAFYDRAMGYQQWRSHKQDLGQVIESDLRSVPETEAILHAHQVQWIDFEQDRDFTELLEEENKTLHKIGEQIKMLPLNEREVLRIRVAADSQTVRVEVKPRLGFIDGTRLRLVRPHTSLQYNAELELAEGKEQVLQLSPLKLARFKMQGALAMGLITQGATFAKVDSFQSPLDRVSEVLWALKKIERHYINPVTDPEYQNLVHQLEKAVQLMKNFHPDRFMIGAEVLKKAENLTAQVFGNDKLLTHLISTLQYHLRRDDAEASEKKCQISQPKEPSAPREIPCQLSPLPPSGSINS